MISSDLLANTIVGDLALRDRCLVVFSICDKGISASSGARKMAVGPSVSKRETMIYAIARSGGRGRMKKIGSGQNASINARIGGVYVVESVDGKIHEIHSPSFPGKTVAIRSDHSIFAA